jgi:hypothetical protein
MLIRQRHTSQGASVLCGTVDELWPARTSIRTRDRRQRGRWRDRARQADHQANANSGESFAMSGIHLGKVNTNMPSTCH